ncbi:MAG: UbiA prenyltransferase family protein [Candidatus Geothermincolia bacterium]
MARLRKYWVLLRIKISLAYFFPLAFGFTIAADANPHIAWWKIPVGFLSFFCASFFASTMNFYADVEADSNFGGKFKDMDLKDQPFVRGDMGALETWLVFVISGIGCVALSLAVNYRFAIFITGFAVVVGLLYSHSWFRLKAKPLTDILVNVVGMGFMLLAGLSFSVHYLPPVLFLVWGALFVTVMYIPTVVNDVPFDEAAGYKTSGVFFGASRLLYSMAPLAAAMIPIGALVALNNHAAWQYRFAAAAGTPLTLAGTAVIFYLWRPPRVELNPNIVLYPMDLAILAFVVYGIVRVAMG